MIQLLQEQLKEYIEQKKEIENQCIELMRQNKEWKELARKAVGIQMLIDVTIVEIAKYISTH